MLSVFKFGISMLPVFKFGISMLSAFNFSVVILTVLSLVSLCWLSSNLLSVCSLSLSLVSLYWVSWHPSERIAWINYEILVLNILQLKWRLDNKQKNLFQFWDQSYKSFSWAESTLACDKLERLNINFISNQVYSVCKKDWSEVP